MVDCPYFPRDEIRRRGIRLVIAKSEIIRIKGQTTAAKIVRIELANHGAPKMEVTHNASQIHGVSCVLMHGSR
jgi:hypothetical protein